MVSEDQHHWDTHLADLERHLNSAVSKASSKSPFEVLHGYSPRYHGGVIFNHSRTRDDWIDPYVQQDNARKVIEQGQLRMKKWYDQHHHQGVKYDVGEVVVMLRQPRPDQNSKLQAKYRERPLQVIKVLPGDTYRVAELGTDGREIYATTAHVSQLKSWKILREDDGEDLSETESEDGAAVNETVRAVRHEVEDEDGDSTSRPTRTKRPPAHLSDYQLK